MAAQAVARVIPIRTARDLMDHDDIVELLGGVAATQKTLLQNTVDANKKLDGLSEWRAAHEEFTRTAKDTQDQLVKDVAFLMNAYRETTGTARAITWGVKIAWGVFIGAVLWMFTMLGNLIVEGVKRGWK